MESEIERLREENEFLKLLLFEMYRTQPKVSDPIDFPISREAIELFEALPDSFTINDVFTAARRNSIALPDAMAIVKVFLFEEMIVMDAANKRIVKTGRKAYF